MIVVMIGMAPKCSTLGVSDYCFLSLGTSATSQGGMVFTGVSAQDLGAGSYQGYMTETTGPTSTPVMLNATLSIYDVGGDPNSCLNTVSCDQT